MTIPAPSPTPIPAPPRAQPFFPLSVVIVAIVVGQIFTVLWKRRSPKSFHRVTLLLLFVFPLIIAFAAGYWRFLLIWTLFTIVTGANLYAANRGNVINDHTVPRRVYNWFFWVYRVSYGLSVVGYLFFVLEIFGLSPFSGGIAAYWGAMLLFYGLYFGVLGRDSAELSTHRMAVRMGLLVQNGIPLRTLSHDQCGVCGQQWSQAGAEDSEIDMVLDCGHRFHAACIRGWALLGKKDTCPFCREKVDLKSLVPSQPWQAENTIWAHILDIVRFCIAWTPILVFVGITVNRILG